MIFLDLIAVGALAFQQPAARSGSILVPVLGPSAPYSAADKPPMSPLLAGLSKVLGALEGSSSPSCSTLREKLPAIVLPERIRIAADMAAVEVNCENNSLNFTRTTSPGSAGSMIDGELFAFATISCKAPQLREMMKSGLTISIGRQGEEKGEKAFTLDCDLVDRAFAKKQPAPPGTPEAIAEGQPLPVEPTHRPVFDFSVGEPLERIARRSSVPVDPSGHSFHTNDKLDIVFRYRGEALTLQKIGGTAQSVLMVNRDIGNRSKLSSVSFHYQDRPLKLGEAIARARELEQWFSARGFEVPASRGEATLKPFEELEPEAVVHGRSSDWASAEAALADDSRNVGEMHLFTMRAPDAEVIVTLENWRRQAADFCSSCTGPYARRSIFDGNGGYEWGLAVQIGKPD